MTEKKKSSLKEVSASCEEDYYGKAAIGNHDPERYDRRSWEELSLSEQEAAILSEENEASEKPSFGSS